MSPERVDRIATGVILGLAGLVGLVILSLHFGNGTSQYFLALLNG